MTNSKHVQKRRFKEFESDSDWEETKLKKLFQYIGNAFVGTATPYYAESGHFYLESNNIKDGQINNNTEVFINDEFYQKQKNKWLQTGDMVMVQSGHVGHAAVIPEYLNNSAAHALIMFRNPSENLESHFLNYQYQTTKAKEKIKTITTGNTIQHILASDMKEYKVYVSKLEEQKKIGNFFQTIDSLITLHQHKLDKLKNLKKAYLAELFPAEGERVPKRRFPGFEAEWERCSLISLCEVFSDGDWIETKDQSNSGVRLIQTGNVGVTEYLDKTSNMKWISEETFELLQCKEVIPGDILISRLPEPAGRACIVPNTGQKMITSVDCTIVRTRPEISNSFLVQYLSSTLYFNEVSTCLAGGTRQRISRSNLADIKINIPSSKKEQDKIGYFFQKLDNSITFQQQKLDKLKDLKKAYLNELFV